MADSARGRFSGIRARTAAAACVVLTVALIAGGFMLVVVMRRSLVEGLDDSARTRAEDVAALIRRQPGLPNLGVPNNDDSIVQVVDADGRVIGASASLDGRGPIAHFRPTGSRVEVRTMHGLDIRGSEHATYLVVARSAVGTNGPMTIYVGADLEEVDESVATVRRLLILGLPVLLALVAGTCWYVVGRALRPVDAMRRELADITAHNLDRRVTQPGTDDEIGRLASATNATLDRLEAFSERQKRFVADASHELQSPLASSLAALEVALAEPDDRAWRATAGGLVAENQRMTRLVQDLLLLARFDDRPAPPTRTLCDLDDIVGEEIARVRAATHIRIDASAVTPVEVRGSAEEFARLVRNLLENATRFARSRIEVTLEARDGGGTPLAILTIADDGPGVPPGDRDRIFERFGRVDDSRSRDTGGTGLGLAIARQVAERHGGTVGLDAGDAGARFVVQLPIDE